MQHTHILLPSDHSVTNRKVRHKVQPSRIMRKVLVLLDLDIFYYSNVLR